MEKKNKLSKSKRNYYIDVAALLPFIMLIITGLIMLAYHTEKPYTELILSKDGGFWLNTHIVFAVITFVIIIIHLSLHINWLSKLVSGKLKNKYWVGNLILLILFLLTTIASALPWLFLDESTISTFLLGVHNKLGLLLIAFFLIHLFRYFNWLVTMTKKVFMNISKKDLRNAGI